MHQLPPHTVEMLTKVTDTFNFQKLVKLDKVNCARSARNTVHRAEWKFAIYKWGGVGLLGGKRSGANNHN